jgi:hypothetical protein
MSIQFYWLKIWDTKVLIAFFIKRGRFLFVDVRLCIDNSPLVCVSMQAYREPHPGQTLSFSISTTTQICVVAV